MNRISFFRLRPSSFILHPSSFILFFFRHDQVAFAQAESQLDCLGQSSADLRAGHQAVDDNLDIVPHLPIQPQVVGQADDAAIDAGTDEPLFQQILEEVAIFAFLAADERSEHQEPRARREHPDAIDDLVPRLGRDRPMALRAVPLADPGKKHAEVVVNFRDRAHRGPRIRPAGLLRNGDCRT